MQPLLSVSNLAIGFRQGRDTVRLLDKVSLNVHAQTCLGIVGESGCGKSITANALMQLLPYPLTPLSGTAVFQSPRLGEVDLLRLKSRDIRTLRGNEMAIIFQEPMTSLDPVYPIFHQMQEALLFHHPKIGRKEAWDRCLDMLKSVKIPRPEHTLAAYPHQLSGGQLQRIMIAIALINRPRLLIADEPTTALDVTIARQILDLMNELKEQTGTAIMMITHDLGVIAQTSDHVAVFYAGHIVEEAPVAALFQAPLHPYTAGLLRSITSLTGKGKQLYAIPGAVPPGGQWPPHCRFYDRCDKRTPACKQGLPALNETEPGHRVRCFQYSREVENA